MAIRTVLMMGLAFGFVANQAHAQIPAVVQLPSFSTFSVDTSVSVPDRGSMSLGGVGRSSIGSTAFGPTLGPTPRAFGRNLTSSTATVHATIHDFDRLDQETLARARANQPRRQDYQRLQAAAESSAGHVPAGSVAEARRRHLAEVASQEQEALTNLAHARAAAASGKTQVAAMFYKLATQHAAGDLKTRIELEAANAKRSPAVKRPASDQPATYANATPHSPRRGLADRAPEKLSPAESIRHSFSGRSRP